MSSEDAVTKKIQAIREYFEAKYRRHMTDEEERYLKVAEKVLREQFPETRSDAAD